MQIKFSFLELKRIFVFLFLLCFGIKGFAHNPDLSSLMIYEQNGKHFFAIKSSLTAFEGEIDYNFNKNAYKTPEEFQRLVSKHFQKKCLLIINNDTIKFGEPTVILGHETTVLVELPDVPEKISELYLKNEMFADLHHSQCEVILMIKEYPQKQYILSNKNLHEVKLLIENGNWSVEETKFSFSKSSYLLLGSLLILSVLIVVAKAIWRKKNV
jgi:hypothetical protein